MFEPIIFDTTFESALKTHGNKKILVYAKIDGANWYDISEYVQKLTTSDRIAMLGSPAISTAKLTVNNTGNVFTQTQYNDTFDPSAGKLNGTPSDNYLSKPWEIKIYAIISKITDGMELPAGAIAYWRNSLLDLLNNQTPNGITPEEAEQNCIVLPLFWGYKPENGITEKNTTAEIILKDRLYITTIGKTTKPILYETMMPDAIINDLLTRAGLSDDLDLQALTTPFDVFLVQPDTTWWNAIQSVVKATGGKITVTPEGKIAFRTQIENYADPSNADIITEDDIQKYTLDKKRLYNEIVVQSQGYKVGDNQELILDTELQGDNSDIAPGQTGTFTLQYNCTYAKDFSDTVNITVKEGNVVIDNDGSFSVGDSDTYVKLMSLDAQPNQLVLQIKNLSDSATYTISHVKFSGIPINKTSQNKVSLPNTSDSPTATLNTTSYYSENGMLSNLADILHTESNKGIVFNLAINGFRGNIYAGNLVTAEIPDKGIANGTFFVEEVHHKITPENWLTNIVIREWSDIAFDISNKTIENATIAEAVQQPSEQTQINELDGKVSVLEDQTQALTDKTAYIDGNAPATPTGLSLSTTLSNGESTVTASWTANTESDLIGYELAWSYDGIIWTYQNVTNNSLVLTVLGNKTVNVKLRALDAEGKKSDWCSVASITSARDTTAPAVPTGLAVTGLFQTIMCKWNSNTEADFKEYILQYDTNSNFSAAKTIRTGTNNAVIKDLNVNTTYYIRLAAIDLSGNQSDWCASVSASTVKLDSSDYYDYAAIKDAIIANGKIDSAWIANLDAGLITTGYLDADRIQAGSITVDKLVAKPAMGLPPGAIAYWTNELYDVISGLTPDGYDEMNLHKNVILTPDNVPSGSVVAGLIAGNKIYAGKNIQVGNGVYIETNSNGAGNIRLTDGTSDIIKIGEDALGTNKPGMLIDGANLKVNGAIKAEYLEVSKLKYVTTKLLNVWTDSATSEEFDLGYLEHFTQGFQDPDNSDYDLLYVLFNDNSIQAPVKWTLPIYGTSTELPPSESESGNNIKDYLMYYTELYGDIIPGNYYDGFCIMDYDAHGNELQIRYTFMKITIYNGHVIYVPMFDAESGSWNTAVGDYLRTLSKINANGSITLELVCSSIDSQPLPDGYDHSILKYNWRFNASQVATAVLLS